MKRVFLLRAYGDFVVALQSIMHSSIKNEFEIIASKHHLPLFNVLKEVLPLKDIPIVFEDWNMQQSLLRLFTNRHLISTETIGELKLLKTYLQNDNGLYNNNFIEQQHRQKALELFTGKKLHAICSQGFVL